MELPGIHAGHVLRPDQLSAPPKLAHGDQVDNEKAAKEMEALFVSQLLKAMRQTIPDGGMMSGGRGEEIARTLQDEAVGKSVAANGGFGLAEQILMDLNRNAPATVPDALEQNPEPKGAG